MSEPDWSRWIVTDPVAFLLNDIQDAEKVELLANDGRSTLFRVTLSDGTSQRGIYYRPTICLPAEWELEDE